MAQDTLLPKNVITLEIPSVWSDKLLESLQTTVLPDYLPLCRWFGQKQRTLTSIAILETRAEQRSDDMRVMLLKLTFSEGSPVTQVLPLFIGQEDEGDSKAVPAVVARFSDGKVLWDALYVATCRKTVWEVLACREAWQGLDLRLHGVKNDLIGDTRPTKTRVLGGEQSNSTLAFDDAYLLKFLRKFEPGPHPDADIIRALGEPEFCECPAICGRDSLPLRKRRRRACAVNDLREEPRRMLDVCSGWCRWLLRTRALCAAGCRGQATELAGPVLPSRMRLLGQRTGEMHRYLDTIEGADFEPEPFALVGSKCTV